MAGVLRDGDVNILLKWAGDNGIKVNPDETTYDISAVNLIAANDFPGRAEQIYHGLYGGRERSSSMERPLAGRDTTVGVDAVATWTPGDVNVATEEGWDLWDDRQYAAVCIADARANDRHQEVGK